MKVIHIITGLNDGGAEGALFRLVTASSSEFDHIVISLMDNGKYGDELISLGIKVVTLNMPRGKVTLKALKLLYAELKREKPDVVQTWMYHADFLGGVIAKLSGCKKIFWGIRHSNLSMDVNSKSTIIFARLCAWLSPWIPTKIISCAEEAVLVHKKFGYRGSFSVVPNGYDTTKFVPNLTLRKLTRSEFNLAEDTPLVGFVARWDPQKDHENLLLAIQIIQTRYPNVCCALIGTGCDTDNIDLISKIQSLGIEKNIMLLGRRNDIPAIMNALDIHVLSSCGEAFPNVVAEAMSSGTPCIVTEVGDAPLIVGTFGWVVPPKDPGKLAIAIDLALREKQLGLSWRKRELGCSDRIKNTFSLHRMVQGYSKNWLSDR
ncbi:glycosyltransferase [Pseudoalteromonas sp. SWYJZ12]|uniref:glycosyltransferase family 4 protein n=1 Tax=Pseudoalteromonas sp. SWYJZ12 TaxID=2792067 RepID=UPI0018CDC6E4|nr:glycosyltransferase [Pseudoalteromonas sp. SWYJZ12]MBH0002713.1 glycosyltransferase [Pseudoalteromonas sp. SWYJZ12]